MFNNLNRKTSLKASSFPNLFYNEDCTKPYVEKTCSTATEEAVIVRSCNILLSQLFFLLLLLFTIYIFLIKLDFPSVVGKDFLIWFTTSGSNRNSCKESVFPKNFTMKLGKYALKITFAHAKTSFFSPSVNFTPQKHRPKNINLQNNRIVFKNVLRFLQFLLNSSSFSTKIN